MIQKETREANKVRRESMSIKTRALKLDPNIEQEKYLKSLFIESKWLYNYVLGLDPFNFDMKIKEITRLDKDKNKIPVILKTPAKIRQDIVKGLQQNIFNLSKAKKKSIKVGRLKFKSFFGSIPLSQFGSTHSFRKGRLKLTGCKRTFKIYGLDQIPEGAEFVSARLVQKPSGYYLHQTYYEPSKPDLASKDSVGIDFGIKEHFTLDSGETFKSYITEPKKLRN